MVQAILSGEFGEMEGFSFLHPDIVPLLIWPFVFAIPLHFVLGGGRSAESRVAGFTDGVWKIYQLYMYMLGHFMFFFLPLMLGVMIGENEPAGVSIAIALAATAVGAFLILYPMLFRAMPGTLAALYGIGRERALISVVGLGMAIFAAHSLITSGQFPE
jgi:hypothetical protein